ncbi:MAG: hypothetical protein EBS38_07595 [Actinobacteria bacterium]|nr:hypothetical protein [Actinomycetota bacterium]
MGNPSTPLEIKRLTGNPGKRPMPDVLETYEIKGGYREPHQPLSWAGKMLWDRTFKVGKTWVGETDVELLLLCCKQLDRQVELEALWQEDKSDFHVMRQLLELEKEIVSNLGKLGMTVDSRSRLGLAEIKAQSVFERLMAERQ